MTHFRTEKGLLAGKRQEGVEGRTGRTKRLLAIGILGLILVTGLMGVAATVGVSVNQMTSFQGVCYPYVSRGGY